MLTQFYRRTQYQTYDNISKTDLRGPLRKNLRQNFQKTSKAQMYPRNRFWLKFLKLRALEGYLPSPVDKLRKGEVRHNLTCLKVH